LAREDLGGFKSLHYEGIYGKRYNNLIFWLQVLGAGVIRGKIIGMPYNFSQGFPDDPVTRFPVSRVSPAFELML
jgi:hypothetical protein